MAAGKETEKSRWAGLLLRLQMLSFITGKNEVIPLSGKQKPWIGLLVSLAVLTGAFLVGLLLQQIGPSQSLVSMILVMSVFLIALLTRGYLWGILASFAGVLINNFVFTFPYFAFDFITAENLLAAVVMLTVASLTSMLTTQLKAQERMKAEAEAEKMRGNLLRAVSHDLRTPLTTIYGSCGAIIDNYGSLDRQKQLALLGQIREDADNLIRMVENLLSVTRVGDLRVQVDKTPTVLEELIDATLMKFHKHYPDQEVQLEIPDDFISIPMDAMLIQQVLTNLLENAVLHAKGMTELALHVAEESGFAVFSVMDDGIGIPRDQLPRLFTGQLGSRNDLSDAGRRGMGIGLSVCAAIIKAHGGEITCENRKEGGACFQFRLEMENDAYGQQPI